MHLKRKIPCIKDKNNFMSDTEIDIFLNLIKKKTKKKILIKIIQIIQIIQIIHIIQIIQIIQII